MPRSLQKASPHIPEQSPTLRALKVEQTSHIEGPKSPTSGVGLPTQGLNGFVLG